MTTIRFHRYTSTAQPWDKNDGTKACDFRGPLFVGDNEGDHHATIPELEFDVADDNPAVALTLQEGPAINSFIKQLLLAKEENAGIPQDQIQLIRVGIWDKIAPGN